MKIGGFESHPAANRYPMLEPEQLRELADDIAENGLRDDIVLIGSGEKAVILDGRNRLKACLLAKVKPRFTQYRGKTDMASLVAFVRSKNRHRRHLSASLRAVIADEEATELGQGERKTSDEQITQREAAERNSTSHRLVKHAAVVRKNGVPEVKKALRAGKLAVDAAAQLSKLPKAEQKEIAGRVMSKGGDGEVKTGHVRALIRQKERQRVIATINANEVKPLSLALGPFRVLLTDFPWPYENSDDHAGARGHIHYPPMPIVDIAALITDLRPRLHDDCIWFGWVTNAFIPDMVDIVRAWGFTWRTMETWTKNKAGTGQWPRGRTEHAVIASRGKPVHTLNAITTWLGEREIDVVPGADGHSRKPPELHDAIEQHCSGPYLEMFARAPRNEKWHVWGAETEKFAGEVAA